MKTTKQGLRDLGGNHRPRRLVERCQHLSNNNPIVVDRRYIAGDLYGFEYDIRATHCIKCGEEMNCV